MKKEKIIPLTIIIVTIIGSISATGLQLTLVKKSTLVNNENPCLPSMLNYGRRKQALVVGVADYPGTVNDLQYTDDDAYDMRDALKKYNWEVTELIDEKATIVNIRDNLKNLIKNHTQDNDVTLFHFSGHGTHFPVRGSALCPYEGYIYSDELADWLTTDNPGKVVVVLDSCYAGGMKNPNETSINLEDEGIYNFMHSFTDALGDKKENRVILMACDENQYSYEDSSLKNGVFSYYVTKGLGLELEEGETGPADSNKDDIITAEETFHYAKEKTVDRMGERQKPQLYDGNKNDRGVYVIDNTGNDDPPMTLVNLTVTIHRIKMLDKIDLDEGADFSYKIFANNGNEWVSSSTDYSNNLVPPENDHSEDATSYFEIHTQYPEIKIKVWDKDPVIYFLGACLNDHDLADISGYMGDATDNNIPDKRSAMFYCKYNVFNNELEGSSDYSEKAQSEYFPRITRGDFPPDSSTDYEGDILPNANAQNDAKVWFTIDDDYETPIVNSITVPEIGAEGKEIQFSAEGTKGYVSEEDGNYEYIWDFGDGSDTTTVRNKQVTHTYETDASDPTYPVSVKIRDSWDSESETEAGTIRITHKPVLNQPKYRKAKKDIQVTATDADGNDVYFALKWGSGSYSDWLGPYTQGKMHTVDVSNEIDAGKKNLKVKVKDKWGIEGNEHGVESHSKSVANNFPTYIFLQERFPYLFQLLFGK